MVLPRRRKTLCTVSEDVQEAIRGEQDCQSINPQSRLPATQINICDSNLHAVDHAEGRRAKGYSVTGIGAVQCRHAFILPTGVGDLQKGER